VIDGEERNPARVGDRFPEAKTNQERADEARPLGHRHRVDCGEIDSRPFEGARDDGADVCQVLAGSELGHDPSVGSMDVYLRGNEVGKNATTVLDDGRRRLVT
jgi:hypothetical protein